VLLDVFVAAKRRELLRMAEMDELKRMHRYVCVLCVHAGPLSAGGHCGSVRGKEGLTQHACRLYLPLAGRNLLGEREARIEGQFFHSSFLFMSRPSPLFAL
jgi:hypothetical protein